MAGTMAGYDPKRIEELLKRDGGSQQYWVDFRRFCENHTDLGGDASALFTRAAKLGTAARTTNQAPVRQSRLDDTQNAAVPRRYPLRAAWFEAELAQRQWTVHDLQVQGGPNWKTSRKVLNGEEVRDIVLDKIAMALSKKKSQVLSSKIPTK
jgi:hypothetical protein